MRKNHKIGIALAVVLIGYLPLAPVFTTSVYGTQPRSLFQGSDGYAYLWLVSRDSFQPYLFFGIWRFEFIGNTNLMFRSEKGNLKEISIADASIEIDGKTQRLSQISGRELQMNFSSFNMYGGDGSSGIIKFDLPEIPKNAVNLHIKGIAVSSDGKENAFDMNVRARVEMNKSTICLFQYLIAKFAET
jgi:hypothetical protein